MNLDHLVAHGFSPRTVENWKRTRDAELLPLQAYAVTRTGLLHGRSTAIFAPTSSGKTFVAELAAARHVERGGRAIFAVPTRALAEEVGAHLRALYSPLGWRVAVSSAELRNDDAAVARGQFELAVIVYEKLRALLVTQPELAGLVSCLVVDELQILGEPERGPTADVLITKFRTAPEPPQIVAMSAVVDDYERIAQWLGAEPLVWHERPVELREGVLDAETGLFRYREWNTRRETTEPLIEPQGRPIPCADDVHRGAAQLDAATTAALIALVRELAQQRGEQVLVFVPTKALSHEVALRLAHELELPADAPGLAAELAEAEDSRLAGVLAQVAACGVAFHNADLPARLRRAVEHAFDAGALRVLVATSTLAQGVNLGCRNVVSLPAMLEHGAIAERPVMVPISRARLRNQGGRAGRYHRSTDFGRSIVLVAHAADSERIFDQLLRQPAEPLAVRVGPEQLAAACLDFLVSHQRTSATHPLAWPREEDVAAFVAQTYGARVMDAATVRTLVRSALNLLEAGQLIVAREGGFAPTGTGEAAAECGLDIATAAHLRECLARWDAATPPDDLCLLLAAAASPQGARFPVSAGAWEIRSGKYLRLFHEHMRAIGDDVCGLPFQLAGGGASARDHAALKKALCAHEWINGRATLAIEEAFGILAGTIEALVSHLAWLVEALAALAARLDAGDDLRSAALTLAARLRHGVPTDALVLARAFEGTLARSHILALVRAGFASPRDVREATTQILARLLPPRALAAIHQPGSHATHADAGDVGNGAFGASEASADGGAGSRTDASAAQAAPKAEHNAACLPHPLSASAPTLSPSATGSDVLPVSPPTATAPGEETQTHPAAGTEAAVAPHRLELDPLSPGVARVDGVQVFLSVLPWRLLSYLARHPRRVVPYAELDAELWPDAKVEQQQILAHKATIVRRFAQVVGRGAARQMLRTVAGHGLYLDVAEVVVRTSAAPPHAAAALASRHAAGAPLQ
jgi:replicative superfamily II helicase/DNA-binding winged helix-turn-helix (wHTH) protein